MNRKSCSTEERARDLLVGFLLALNRRPLDCFLRLIFDKDTPSAFQKSKKLTIQTEVECFGRSRVDLLIAADSAVLCVEVKVDAAEQVGQYLKYHDYFLSQKKTVHVAGLINRCKGPNSRNDNEPSFQFLGIRRIIWSELLEVFEKDFGGSFEFKQFSQALHILNLAIGKYSRSASQPVAIKKECDSLASNNWVLMEFYRELHQRFAGWDAAPNKYGNAPYELHLGKRDWAKAFNESSCRRIVLGLNQPREGKLLTQPYFAPGIMLWNRSWFSDEAWFISHREAIAAHFDKLGYQVVRNAGDSWHTNADWSAPYPTRGIKFANAFWEKKFSLAESDYCRLGWEKTLDRLEKEILLLARHVDSIRL